VQYFVVAGLTAFPCYKFMLDALGEQGTTVRYEYK